MLGYLPCGRGLFDRLDEKGDAGVELLGRALERGQRLLVASGLARGIGDAPVDQPGRPWELGAYLAHAIAEADHVVEALPGELAQMLGATPGEVDVALAHHADRVGVKRLRMAARAVRAEGAVGQPLREGLGDLRARAVAGAEEEHARERGALPVAAAGTRGWRQAGMQGNTCVRQELAATRQIEHVVAVAAVSGAAALRDKALVAQLTQVVRDQALAPPRRRAELAHTPIAARQLAQEPPPQRMPRQPQKPRRRVLAMSRN